MKKTILFLATMLITAGACSSPAPELSESEEYYAGRSVAKDILLSNRRIDDQELQEYVNLVGWTVAVASDRPQLFNGWTFGVIESEKLNSVAAPSGFIFITSGMVKLMETEDELAAVLAHEIAHVVQRHPELALQAQVASQQSSSILGSLISVGAQVTDIATGGDYGKELAAGAELLTNVSDVVTEQVLEKGYEREQEYEADHLAIDYLSREEVKYDPNALCDVLERIAKLGVGPDKFGGFFNMDTHPDPMDRVRAAREHVKNCGYVGTTPSDRTARFRRKTASLK